MWLLCQFYVACRDNRYMMSIEFKGNHNSPRRTRRARRREKDWLSGFIHAGFAVIPEIPPFRSAQHYRQAMSGIATYKRLSTVISNIRRCWVCDQANGRNIVRNLSGKERKKIFTTKDTRVFTKLTKVLIFIVILVVYLASVLGLSLDRNQGYSF
jgi:hypothetical protein